MTSNNELNCVYTTNDDSIASNYCLLFLRTGSLFLMNRLAVAAADGPLAVIVAILVGLVGGAGRCTERAIVGPEEGTTPLAGAADGATVVRSAISTY
jgi:hypothetical protein